MESKVCTCCGLPKPLSEFHHFGKDLARVGKWCEECYQKNKGSPAKTPGAGAERRPSN